MSTSSCIGRQCGSESRKSGEQSRLRTREAEEKQHKADTVSDKLAQLHDGLGSRMDSLQAQVGDNRAQIEGRDERMHQLHVGLESRVKRLEVIDRLSNSEVLGSTTLLENIASSQQRMEELVHQLPQQLETMFTRMAPMRGQWSRQVDKLDDVDILNHDGTGHPKLRPLVPYDPPVPFVGDDVKLFWDQSHPKPTLHEELARFHTVMAKDFSEELTRQLEPMSRLIASRQVSGETLDREGDPPQTIEIDDAIITYAPSHASDDALDMPRVSQIDSERVRDDEMKLKMDGAFGSMFLQEDLDYHLDQPQYDVEKLYKDTGVCQYLARSEKFNNAVLLLIFVNAIYLGFEVDRNNAETLYDASIGFIICDHAFCLLFFVEICIRFFAFRQARDSLRDGWFRFDICLVGLTILDTWVIATITGLLLQSGLTLPTGPFRLFRLLRLTRMSRLLEAVPELITMTRALLMAARAVVSAVMMVLLLMFSFSVVMVILLKEHEVNKRLYRNFSSMLDSMFTLFIDGTLMDEPGAVMTELKDNNCYGAVLVFVTYALISAVLVMNMLIGVLCEVVSSVTRKEKDEAAVRFVKQSILMELKKFDDGDGMITREELDKVMHDEHSKAVLASLNVDRLFLTELQSALFQKKGERVTISGIIELMLMCRGDLPSTVQHIATGQAFLHSLISRLDKHLTKQLQQIQEVLPVRAGRRYSLGTLRSQTGSTDV